MARISCEPCEIISVCDCCHEILCECGKNKVFQCDDPCFPIDQGPHVPGGFSLPHFIEGMVPDHNVLGDDQRAVVGPPVSSVALSGWDTRYNFFDYQFISYPSTTQTPFGSYTNDLSNCELGATSLVPAGFFSTNENLKSEINIVVSRLINKTLNGFPGYIPAGAGTSPTFAASFNPYNEIDYLLFRDESLLAQSLSDTLLDTLDSIGNKCVTSYRFSEKYKKAIAKSILFGYFDTYFYNGKLDLIKQFSENSYKNKAVPALQVTPRFAGQFALEPTSVYATNLENMKTYIGENRIRMHSGEAGQRLSNKILKQYWKFIPSDINLRVRVHRTPEVKRYVFGQGLTVTATNTGTSSIASVGVNDDDTITVYTLSTWVPPSVIPAGKARVHYINAEHLRVFNNSGGHVYLDEVPRYQEGCGCCTSGCFISLCSDRERAYVFDTMDRSVLLGMGSALSGTTVSSFDPDPYIKLTVSAPFSNEIEFGNSAGGNSYDDLKDFYLLATHLSGTDILSGVVDYSASHVKTTSLEYKLAATSTKSLLSEKPIDRAVRFKAGPGNVFYISNDDPIFNYLNYLDSYAGRDVTVSAVIPDLNLSGILDRNERYPRRIPAHILIIPTDQPIQNPLFGKSLLTKMEDGTQPERDDGVIRTIKMVPAPTEEVLNSSYLGLVENNNASLHVAGGAPPGYLPYGYGESDKMPFGPQGTSTNPLKMQFTASNIYERFNNWQGGEEGSRRVDPIRKVFDFLTSAVAFYDTRVDVTYTHGVYPAPNLAYGGVGREGLFYDPIYPIYGYGDNHQCLPLFDVWRHLNTYEFQEFVSSFRDTLFQKLMSGKYRKVQLFHMMERWPEKTHIHRFVPPFGLPNWSTVGSYEGSISNPRCASGVQIRSTLEDSLLMDIAEERDC